MLAPVLLLSISTGLAAAQEGSVGGTVVTEQTQRPLAGAQVLVEGTGRGTLTDERGRLLITGLTGSEVPLRVMIGYRSVTQPVQVGDTDVNIALTETAIELDKVVVTGTTAGTERLREIGNAVSTVNAAEIVETAPIQNMQQMLKGRADGVFVVPASGMVGGGQTAVNVINELRDEHDLPPVSAEEAQNIQNTLIEERRRELWLEGQRLYDINGFDLPLIPAPGTLYPKGGVYGNVTCLPLPEVERANNPNIG